MPKDSIRVLYEPMTLKVKLTEWAEKIELYLEKSEDFKVEDSAVDFTMKTLAGSEISLSDYSGKYVLLEFWATCCDPCRKENPILRKAYSEFKSKGFEILGVSFDEKKEHWAKTVEQDSISWTTVSDLKGMGGEVATIYSISYPSQSASGSKWNCDYKRFERRGSTKQTSRGALRKSDNYTNLEGRVN